MRLTRIFAGICTIALLFCATACTNSTEKQEEKAKYVFLFIGDGMGISNIAVTESYLSYKAGKLGGEMLTMTQFPYFGTATSYSADSNVTDSSASGTAIASGEKTYNTGLGVDASGEPVKSMAYDLKEDGYQIGIISTVPINHATPGSFYASSKSRNDYYGISKQIVGSGFEFFAGSGFIDYNGKKDNPQEPIDAYLESNGYLVSYGIEEFKAEAAGKDNVVFCQESNRSESAGNYVSSGKIAEDASLGQMLQLGLEQFDTEKPFFFMCEGGKIDWTAHDNKVMPMIMDILEFDQAIEVALEFYKEHKDETLIVVTADHETGGVSLGTGEGSVNWNVFEEQWETDGQKNSLKREDNEELNRKGRIGWTTRSHTGGPVPVFAIGKGAEKFSGRMDNTDIKGKILCE